MTPCWCYGMELSCRLIECKDRLLARQVVVGKRAVESPCVLVSGDYGWSANMERLMKAQTLRDNTMAAYMCAPPSAPNAF